MALTILFFFMAALYASVGHGGGSGYLAAMGLLNVEPDLIKPTALTLNILVSSIAALRFYLAGHFSLRLIWPLVLASVPMAFLGGRLHLATSIYRPLVGLLLLYAAWRLFLQNPARAGSEEANQPNQVWQLSFAGVGIGLLSGLVGVGGGIFLSPLLLLAGWANVRRTMAASAAFVLANSVAGLLGHLSSNGSIPPAAPIWLLAVAIGGWIGSEYGSRQSNTLVLRRLLAVVLVVAAGKMLFF